MLICSDRGYRLLAVFAREELLAAVEQVEELAAVDLVERDVDLHVLVLLRGDLREDLFRGEHVEAFDILLGVSDHREGFARACVSLAHRSVRRRSR